MHSDVELKSRVRSWAKRLRVSPNSVRIQRMTQKWGSCSTLGTVTLASDLANCDFHFQDFVIVHELLHLRFPNHGRLFKTLLTTHVPAWRTLNLAKRKEEVPRVRKAALRESVHD